MKILIVEGNTGEIISQTRKANSATAYERYQQSLALYASDAEFHVSAPFAPDISNHGDLSSYDGFALTGSGVSWSAADEEVKPYLDHLRAIFDQAKPVIGSCWGMQTVAQLFGGHSGENPKGTEIGIAENIELTPAGRAHYVFEGVPDTFASPCIHRDHVLQMPQGFEVLAGNPVSEIQAMASTRPDIDYVGFQFHPEFDLEYIEAIVSRRNISLVDQSMIAAFEGKYADDCSDVAARTKVYANWINHVRKQKAATEAAAA